MKNIKFKAYFKNKVYDVVDLDLKDKNVVLVSIEKDESVQKIGHYKSLDEVEIVQYTGLKDIDNVPIYEGDILKHITNCEQVGVVSFKKSSFYLTLDEQDGCFYLDNCNEVCKIIGNIYQNPELFNN